MDGYDRQQLDARCHKIIDYGVIFAAYALLILVAVYLAMVI